MKPILSMTPSSISMRSTALGGQRVAVALVHARRARGCAGTPSPTVPSGQSKLGISWPPSGISTSQRSAISSVDSIAPGNSRERLHHLLRGLQIELVRAEGHLRRGQRGLRLHAQQRRVVVEVLPAQVVHVRRADQRRPVSVREALHRLVDLVLLGQPVLLDLEIDVLGAEDLDQLVQVRARLVELALHDPLARAAGQAARERDDALGVHRRAAPGPRPACRGAGPRGSPC